MNKTIQPRPRMPRPEELQELFDFLMVEEQRRRKPIYKEPAREIKERIASAHIAVFNRPVDYSRKFMVVVRMNNRQLISTEVFIWLPLSPDGGPPFELAKMDFLCLYLEGAVSAKGRRFEIGKNIPPWDKKPAR